MYMNVQHAWVPPQFTTPLFAVFMGAGGSDLQRKNNRGGKKPLVLYLAAFSQV